MQAVDPGDILQGAKASQITAYAGGLIVKEDLGDRLALFQGFGDGQIGREKRSVHFAVKIVFFSQSVFALAQRAIGPRCEMYPTP